MTVWLSSPALRHSEPSNKHNSELSQIGKLILEILWSNYCRILTFKNDPILGSQDAVIREEVCLWETFKKKCPHRQILHVLSSVYGRFYESRCAAILNDTHSIHECSTDVLTFVKSQCERKSFCEIQLPEKHLDRQSISCRMSELKSLKIAYSCSKGWFNSTSNASM